MQTIERDDRWVTAAGVAVSVFAVALPVPWLLYFPSFVSDAEVGVAWVSTAAFVALHLGHVRYGLRDEAPPRGRWTFAVMAIVMVVGYLVIGPRWTLMFASLAPAWPPFRLRHPCSVNSSLGDDSLRAGRSSLT